MCAGGCVADFLCSGFFYSASRMTKLMAGKMRDGADPRLPSGQLRTVAWMVTANSEQELAAKLAEVCAVLLLPGVHRRQRRLMDNQRRGGAD